MLSQNLGLGVVRASGESPDNSKLVPGVAELGVDASCAPSEGVGCYPISEAKRHTKWKSLKVIGLLQLEQSSCRAVSALFAVGNRYVPLRSNGMKQSP